MRTCGRVCAIIQVGGFWRSLETLIRILASRPDPPTVVLFNTFTWLCASPPPSNAPPHECAAHERCDMALSDLAAYYHLSVISVRDAMYIPFRHKAPHTQSLRFTFATAAL